MSEARRGTRVKVALAALGVTAALAIPVGLVASGHVAESGRPSQTAVTPNAVGDVKDLTPALRTAITAAMAAAAADGVELRVTSGWRSKKHQKLLYEEAIEKYGSAEAARQWVLPPAESAHVRGEAVDVGPAAGARWLEENGSRFGLCRRYANETWHFELLAPRKGSSCPSLEPHA
jgi:LAS superfamily LD-carboxypeptidase LdcB